MAFASHSSPSCGVGAGWALAYLHSTPCGLPRFAALWLTTNRTTRGKRHVKYRGVLDGDWVIVEQRDHARDGEIVVALIDGNDATLKRITQRPDEVRLTPANSAMKPLIYPPHSVQIQGVVVGQMRAYR